MTKPEILFLSHRIPYPPDKGDKIRSWRWLKHLTECFSVHLACFVDDPRDFEHAGYLGELCETAALVPLNPNWSRLKSLQAIAEGLPFSFRYFHSGGMKRAVAAARARPLVAEFAFSSAMAPYIEAPVSDRIRIIDFCDADSAKWLQYAQTSRGAMSWLYQREGRLLALAETRIANWADASLAVSPEEASVFNNRKGVNRPVLSIPNGVDTEFFNPANTKPVNAHVCDVIFVGAMDYRANIEGVLHFMKDVWPKVRAQKPDARFTIVGSNPDHKISALNSRGGITVTDRVDDVRPWLAGAKVVIAPLRVARGVQNKVLEAMAMAKPVIASAEAMTGINTPEDASVIALNPDDMADAIISLLRDEARCIALGKAARDYVQEQFGWRSSLDQLDQLLAKLGVYSSSSEEGGNESSSPISATR